MPNKEAILFHARSLKSSDCFVHEGKLEEDQKWSGKEHGAEFELTKPEGNIFEKDFCGLQLVIKGKVKSKESLRKDFVEVLGKPSVEMPAKRFGHPQMLIWNTADALVTQSK